MATLPLPQPSQDLTEPVGQPGRVGQIAQQPGTGVADHPAPSALTMILGRVPVVFTAQVPSVGIDKTLSKSYLPSSEGTSSLLIHIVDGLNERPRLDDFEPHHYAFMVSEQEFDAAVARIQDGGIIYSEPVKINETRSFQLFC